MSCFLCGHESKRSHHLGCAKVADPNMTKALAVALGLLPRPVTMENFEPDVVEVLKDGTMTTVPEEEIPAGPGETVEQCVVEGCDNPRYSTSARARYCAEHKDPKNRKE